MLNSYLDIEPHFCSCLQFSPISLNESNHNVFIASRIVKAVLDTINDYNKVNQDLCSQLELKKIDSLTKLLPQTSLLRFKKNKDNEGFIPDMGEPTKMTVQMYQSKYSFGI